MLKGKDIKPPKRIPSLLVVLTAGSLIVALALGARSTMGIFLDPVSDGLGLGTGSFALMVAVQNLIWGIGQPIAGALADRFGTRRVLVIGAVIYSVGILVLANATGPAGLHLGGGLLMGLGMAAASFSVVLAAIGRLVDESRRSFALGVATAFGSVGQFVLIPVARILIDATSWETALLLLAGLTALIAVFCAPLRNPGNGDENTETQIGDVESLREVFYRATRNRSYLLLNVGFFVCGFHVTFIGVHLPKYLEDVGQTAGVAAAALAFIGLFNIAGSLAAGAMGQRHSKSFLLSLLYGARGLVILGFILLPKTPAVSIVFGCLMGLLWLSTIPLTSGIVMSQFGTKHSGALFGVVFLSHQIGAFIGSWGAGIVRDNTGSYMGWWWTAVALGAFGALIHLFIDEGPVAPTVEKVPRSPIIAPVGVAVLMWLALSVATIAPLLHGKGRIASGALFCWINFQETNETLLVSVSDIDVKIAN